MTGATRVSVISLWILTAVAAAQSTAPLHLEKSIPLPDVQGRIDHMFLDASTNRLFVAALGNNTVEVIDVKHGTRIHTIPGLREPQGVLYLPEAKKLYVANGSDGTFRLFDGNSYESIKTVKLGQDADNIRFDPAKKHIYVGYGSGALAALDEDGTKIADVSLSAHPESFQLERSGTRLFVNVPESRIVAVVDRNTGSVTAKWQTGTASSNFPMSLDDQDHRLFIVCRAPARLIVLDTSTGNIVASLAAVGDSDDVFYDRARRRLYATGGEGAISVFKQQDPNHYQEIAKISTRKGARTSFFSPELDQLFVAARRQGSEPAAIFCYSAQ